MQIQLTTTDFVRYPCCPKSLWTLKREPENYPQGKPSAFGAKLASDGHGVEGHVRWLREKEGRMAEFQQVSQAESGLFARADAFEKTGDGSTVLHEIKSSTRIKDDNIKDDCFQRICTERAGRRIDRISLVHLNGEYDPNGQIHPNGLLVFADIIENVREIESATATEIDDALELPAGEMDREGCSCIEEPRGSQF